MKGAAAILAFLLAAQRGGERTALVTLTGVIGSSSRAPGTHMGVSETGSIGSFSGGCVEAAVIAEARRVIGNGRAELVRFGAGSPYLDVRLPCGGGIDLLVTPDPDALVLREALQQLERREPVSLRLGLAGELGILDDIPASWKGDDFRVRHDPDLRLIILGHGAEVLALARLATTYDALVDVLTPDEVLLAGLGQAAIPGRLLTGPKQIPSLEVDPYTAIVFLFHDHDWETDLLAWALGQDAFFVGAMGSRTTDANRRIALAERGLSPAQIALLSGPIGLIPTARDPETLALSVLAQVVDDHRKAAHEARS